MDKNVKTVHYLGSKARMLTPIKKYIDVLNQANGRVCDLFCGSGVVSEYLLQQYDILAADIQNYSRVYCEARLTGGIQDIDCQKIESDIKDSFVRKMNLDDYKPILDYEDKCRLAFLNGELAPMYEIIEKGSLYAYLGKFEYAEDALSPELEQAFFKVEKNVRAKRESIDSVIVRYYGGLYFSYRQAIDIDAIASYAFTQNEPLKSKILAALMGAATDVVNTVGKQFAQPLKVKNKDGSLKKNLTRKIKADRDMDVFAQFYKWMIYYMERPQNKHSFEVVCDDYVEVLRNLKPGDVEVVYADPPYTRYHYSRYYHILETICLHDNPQISTTFPNGKGGLSRAIYRNDRHQSPFCIKSKAPKAFEDMFQSVNEIQASIVLSYSPFDANSRAMPRLLSIDEIVGMAKKYYRKVEVVSPGQFMHSRFNRQDNNYEINYEAERLIICRK
ncbi:MAG: DNA adenine methylase [Lachnospiraceae bacterium]|nr:DNA adenine methylase [Lachnospiraceae bacterium]